MVNESLTFSHYIGTETTKLTIWLPTPWAHAWHGG
jgi:hypothetical protein